MNMVYFFNGSVGSLVILEYFLKRNKFHFLPLTIPERHHDSVSLFSREF
jgi:hypothetical protein